MQSTLEARFQRFDEARVTLSPLSTQHCSRHRLSSHGPAVEVDLLEVLQRMSFLTLHSADIETQENCITLSGQEQKETF